MRSTTGYDDQFIVHPDDVKEKTIHEKNCEKFFGNIENLPTGTYTSNNYDNAPVISNIGKFEEDPFTSDFPFEIKAIFWVMVVIAVGMLFGWWW